MFHGVIFDVDGVIVDTENTHYLTYKAILAAYGYELPWHKYKTHFSGKSIKGGLLSFFKEHPFNYREDRDKFIEDFSKRKISETTKVVHGHVDFFPDTLAFIQNIKDGNVNLIGVGEIEDRPKLALTTGMEDILMKEILSYHELRSTFSVVVTPSQYTHSKPDPECYLKTLELMELKSYEVVGIEDSPAGIKALNSAGIFSIGLTNTHNSDELNEAKKTVGSLSELLTTTQNKMDADPPSRLAE